LRRGSWCIVFHKLNIISINRRIDQVYTMIDDRK
jgi:hypothetical protein